MIEVSLRLREEGDLPDAVDQLAKSGIASERIEVLTRQPLPDSALPVRPSRMSKIGVIGAVLGFSAAVAGLVTITLSAHLHTGGMPLIAPLPLGVITYEMTLLASVLAIVLALLLGARLGPGRRVVHHPELGYGEAIVSVSCADLEQAQQARDVLSTVHAAARACLPALLVLLLPVLNADRASAQTFRRDCAPCHGSGGEGRIGPQLAGRAWSADVFTKQVRQGGLLMPAFSARDISDAQLQELLAFVDKLPAPAAAKRLPAPSPNAPGASVFKTNCVVCHGAEARGGIAPGILNTALTQPQFTQQVRRGGGIMPPFSPTQVSDADIGRIYAFLHPALPRPDPGTVDTLPSVPNYVSDTLFALALLALLGQLVSEGRRRLSMRIQSEAKIVQQRFPEEGETPLQVRVF